MVCVLPLSCPGAQTKGLSLTEPGRFVIGCNYWASHAGTDMWRDWRPDVVDADFAQLSGAGLQVLRVFPLWPDFQPIRQLYTAGGDVKEIRFTDGAPLPAQGPGRSGVSEEALSRFRILADLAGKHDLKLIVGLVTGWMSGQLYVPPALEGRGILSDPSSLMWQTRFVKAFVAALKDHPAILAWDLGNECNVMENLRNKEEAFVWTAAVSNAIRVEDPSRPVVSGMHSLSPADGAVWRIQDQAELNDLLTTHPYPFWVPHAAQDPVHTIRTVNHSAAETRLYADIGGKPCLVEEIGIMGPMRASEAVKAAFCRTVLFNTWANDGHGLLWWCGYDQMHITQTPYDWVAVERELGLFRVDRSAKPVLNELTRFGQFLRELPFKVLPPRHREAVCIVTEGGQDSWGVAYSAFVLAKQAGFDIEFQHSGQALKPSPLYLMPSIRGINMLTRKFWFNLLDAVEAGAVLYASLDEGFLSPFNEPFGLDVITNANRAGQASFVSSEAMDSLRFHAPAPVRLELRPRNAEVLAAEEDGNPVFTVASYGKGKIYFLTIPIEIDLTRRPGGFHEPGAAPLWKIYRHIASPFLGSRVLSKQSPMLGSTEHDLSGNERAVVLINFSPGPITDKIAIRSGWGMGRRLYGSPPSGGSVTVPANDAVVFTLRSRD
jgi:hypothetical protein